MNGVKELTNRNSNEMTKYRQAERCEDESESMQKCMKVEDKRGFRWIELMMRDCGNLCSRVAVAFGSIVSRSHNSPFSPLPSPSVSVSKLSQLPV